MMKIIAGLEKSIHTLTTNQGQAGKVISNIPNHKASYETLVGRTDAATLRIFVPINM